MPSHRRVSLSLMVAVGLASFWLTGLQECAAQVARYQPQTPTLSPYLNLNRFNGRGGFPNYFALVRPQIRQREINLQNRGLLRRQERQIIQLENEVQQGLEPTPVTGTGSWFMIPGNTSTFMNTTQFYPQPAIRQQRR